MADSSDPLQQIAREHNNNKKKNDLGAKLLNELDDLDNKVLISPSKSPRQHSKSNFLPKPQQKQNSKQQRKKNVASNFPIKKKKSGYQNGKNHKIITNGNHYNNKNNKNSNNDQSSFCHETHTLRETILYGLFEDEYEGYGKLHNESAMLHCGASYILSDDQIVDGEIHLTNFLLYFVPKQMDAIPGGIKHLILPIASIAKITEQQRSNNYTEIILINRVYRTIKFRFASDKQINYISSDKVLQMLRALTFPNRMIDLFAFEYYKRHPSIIKLSEKKANTKNPKNEHENDTDSIMLTPSRKDTLDDDVVDTKEDDIWGWDIYDIEKEYNRMGVYMDKASSSLSNTDNVITQKKENDDNDNKMDSNSSMKRHRQYTSTRMPNNGKNSNNNKEYPRYRFTSVNRGYEICDSYPELFVVPSSITDWELQQVARFRRLGRIPILSWKSSTNNVALFRCSQPKVAMASNRSRADEHLIQSIAEANNIQNSVLYIMDARPKLNARANKIKGGGFENTNFYKNTKLEFLDIDNIHIMRKSRKSLASLIEKTSSTKDKEWLQLLGKTEWLQHIRQLLKGTYSMIRVLTREKCSVLCHCSDGWDRTSQLCCLVQLCLDSYCRTIKGFIILINKEWLSVGHQFDKRCGHRKDDSFEEDERSPIFEQFIECTWQLIEQYPLYFEFNQQFLICIMDHLYSCKYGTFLCDKLKQRQEYKLSQRTLSLWTHLQNCSNSKRFINIYYNPIKKQLIPKYSLKILKFWKGWHLRNCPQHISKRTPMFNDNGNQQIKELYIKLKKENDALKKEIETMRQNSKNDENDEENTKANRPPIIVKQDSQFD